MSRPTLNRSALRIADLKRRRPVGSRLLNVKIHAHDAIAQLAKQLGVSKTEMVVALLNEALEAWRKRVNL